MTFTSLRTRLTTDGTTLALIVAGYLALVCNLPFFAKAIEIFQRGGSTNAFFAATLPVTLWTLIALALIPFSFRAIAKPVLAPVVLLSAAFSYAGFTYGIVFDGAMFTNIFETDAAEAVQYLNAQALLALAATGVLPALVVACVPLRKTPLKKEFARKSAAFGLLLVAVLALVAVNYDEYAVVGRNNRGMTKLVVPLHPLKKLAQTVYARNFAHAPPYRQIATDATLKAGPRPRLVVMLLGETQRAMNYALNGYARDTNPFTRPFSPVSFRHATSFGTSTAVSVPYIFSMASRDYDDNEAYRDNVLDVAKRAGVTVLWRDNDGGCKKACKGVDFADLRKKYAADKTLCKDGECYDGVVEAELAAMLPALEKRDTLIVFHLEGAHGPGYYERYPASFRRFTPDCPRTDIQNCSREALVNTYDNTILHDDHVMAGLMKRLSAASNAWDTHLLFLSDHGESLGENGLYLHSFPRSIAPAEQTQVPLIYWQPQMAARECFSKLADNTHEKVNLADTLLGLTGVETASYKAENDILARCRRAVPAVATSVAHPRAIP